MNWHWTIVHPLLITASLGSLVIAIYAWRNQSAPARGWMVGLLLNGVLWVMSMAIEIGLPTPLVALAATFAQFSAIALIPFLYQGFVCRYLNIPGCASGRALLLGALVPGLTIFLALTNARHELLWRQAVLVTGGNLPGLSLEFGPGLYFFLGYLLFVLAIGTWALYRQIRSRDRIYRSQALTIITGVCATALLSLIDFAPFTQTDYFITTALSYNVIAMVIAGRLTFYLRSDLWAASREITFNGLRDPLLVLDPELRIIDLNPAARQICAPEAGNPLGQPIQSACPALTGYIHTDMETTSGLELRLPVDGTPRVFEVRLTYVREAGNQLTSVIVLLQNITRLKAVEGSIRRHTLEIEALLNSARLISSSLQLEEMVTRLAEHLGRTMQVSGVIISWWEAPQDQLKTWVEWHLAGSQLNDSPGQIYPLAEYPLTRRVLQERLPQQVQVEDPLADQAEVATMVYNGVASLLMLPLAAGEEVIGLVELEYHRSHPFSPGEVRLGMALADQLAVAVQNALRNRSIRERLHEQTLLRQAGERITATLDQVEMLRVLAEQFTLAGNGTSGYICTYDFEKHASTVIAEYIGEQAREAERESDLGATYTFQETTDFLSHGTPVSYYPGDPLLSPEEHAHLEKYGVETVLIIPIQLKEEVIAFAEIWETRARRAFTASEINLCQDLAQHAALALHNAELYRQAQQELNERRRVEDILRHKALHDALTGLPNRVFFSELLEQAIARLKRHPEDKFAVLYLDLDHFKDVNDSLGHSYGDAFLGQVTVRLCQQVRQEDTVARIGGDEFAILLDHVEEPLQAVQVSERIQESLSHPVVIESHELRTSASIGIVISSDHYTVPEEYLRDADIAMYQAKESGKACYAIFDRTMHAEILARLKIESELHRALELEELLVHYQPIIRLADQEIVGFEALVRWQHSTRGLLLPDSFIPLAERNGSVTTIDRWVMSSACDQVSAWQAEFPKNQPWSISLNFSARNFNDPQVYAHIVRTLQACGLAPDQLRLEITESALIEDQRIAAATLERLKRLGIDVQLDDFGTGYSSLHHLRSFPIDSIKIDRSFIGQMDAKQSTADLVRTMLLLARELGKQVIAEGVEDQAQARALSELGCQFAQGYGFAPPLPAEAISSLLASTRDSDYRLEAGQLTFEHPSPTAPLPA